MPSGTDEGETSGLRIMPGIGLEFDPLRVSHRGNLPVRSHIEKARRRSLSGMSIMPPRYPRGENI